MTENLILVTLDSLRADHCGPTNRGEAVAPTLRRLASEGVEYTYAIAPGPRTPSSMPVIFTGEHMARVDQHAGDFWTRRRTAIRHHMRRHQTLPERLQAQGYYTIGVTVNPWTQDTGFDRGFDEYVHVNSGTLTDYGPKAFQLADRVLSDTSVGDKLYWFNKREWFIRWTDFYDAIRDRLQAAPEPYFLWVFLLDTHQPYIVPSTDRRESSALGMYYASLRELATSGEIPQWVDTRLRRAYQDSIRSVDRFLARLLEDTAPDDPVVVVHSDHGEAFGEHGTYGHEQQLYEENIHVPCLVHNVPVHARVSAPFSLRRLPQLVDALVEPTAFDPTAVTAADAIATIDDGQTTAVTTGEWKLIQHSASPELYDLTHDPAEQTNLACERTAVRDLLEGRLHHHQRHRSEQSRIATAIGEEVVKL